MSTNRRDFIEKLGATAMLGALPWATLPSLSKAGVPVTPEIPAVPGSPIAPEEWDFRWVTSLKGKRHKAVMDCAEVESGYGLWRANFFPNQYMEVLGAKAADIGTVLVLRHNALVLAFQQPLWDELAIAKDHSVTHPLTLQSSDRNPALLSSTRNEIPAQFDAFALPNFIQRGGIALACNMALGFFVMGMAAKLNISQEEARRRAIAAFVPGVVLQPSGVFAAVRAQEEGCQYVRAS
jgi:hypothetical protein